VSAFVDGNRPRHQTPDSRAYRARLRRKLIAAARHQPSHDALLDHPDLTACGPTPGLLDLVVVPTGRPFAMTREAIATALQLAAPFDALVLVLCSHEARLDEFPTDLVPDSSRVVLVDFGQAQSAGHVAQALPVLKTSEHDLAPGARWDTADKRNFALLSGAVEGMRQILFLDDDVTPAAEGPTLSVGTLAAALTLLRDGQLDAGGWILADFPDNSVVCHARRLAGLPQGVFVGAAALAVRLGPATPFFPAIYNEDWLFQYPMLASPDAPHRFAAFGAVRQARYQPYRVARARHEEVGDLLAEGLYQKLQGGETLGQGWSCAAFWHEVIRQRTLMISQIQTLLRVPARMSALARWQRRFARPLRGRLPSMIRRNVPWVSSVPHRMWRRVQVVHLATHRVAAVKALDAALTLHGPRPSGAALAEALCDWVAAWREDLTRWRDRLREPPVDAVRRVLDDELLAVWIGPSGDTRPAEAAGSAQTHLGHRA
jgi:hypothetical protein